MLNPLQLLGMARGVASGMEYLARMHFVHRVRKYFIFFEEYRKLDKYRAWGQFHESPTVLLQITLVLMVFRWNWLSQNAT